MEKLNETDKEIEDIVVVGSGGLAREVRWLLEECNKIGKRWNILGWISKEEPGTIIDGLPVLGDDKWLEDYRKFINAVVGIGKGQLRKQIVSHIKQNKHIFFPIIISPSAEISDSVVLGEGSVVAAKSVLTVGIEIGEFFFCNLACTVGHDCRFDGYVTLHPGSNISGNVNLGECVTIGTGSAIIQGVSVGANTTIGAGASVVRDIPSDCVAVGVPARTLERTDD